MDKTIHFLLDNKERFDLIDNVIGRGHIIDTFHWDKGHRNGAELHYITDTGIIIIRNEKTLKYVTMLIARPQQIRRYYQANNKPIPQHIVDIAYRHFKLGYHLI